MRAGIVQLHFPISAARQYLATAHEHSPDGTLASFKGSMRFTQCHFHEVRVVHRCSDNL